MAGVCGVHHVLVAPPSSLHAQLSPRMFAAGGCCHELRSSVPSPPEAGTGLDNPPIVAEPNHPHLDNTIFSDADIFCKL